MVKNLVSNEKLDKSEIQIKIRELQSSLNYLDSIKTEVHNLN